MIILSKNIDNAQPKTRRDTESYAVQSLLNEHFGYHVELRHLDNGKPYLPYEALHISISHTKGRIALALSYNPIGIDIEPISPRLQLVTPRILTPETLAQTKTYSPEQQYKLYHLLWTAAEALFKLVPESTLISDFDYLLDTIVWDKNAQPIELEARYKQQTENTLIVRSCCRDGYVLTTAQYRDQLDTAAHG